MRILIVTQYIYPENFKSNELAFELAKTMIKDTLLNLEHKKIIKKFFHINFNN